MAGKLFLIDAMPLLYRGHFIFLRAPRITSNGENTSALYGYVNSLIQILESEQPTHIAVCFDTQQPTFRHEMYSEYKAQREAMPEDIAWAIPASKELTRALNIALVECPGFEADDIIGTIAAQAAREDVDTYMVTPDKDFAQLVGPRTYLYRPGKGGAAPDIMGIPEVLEKWGIQHVEQIIDLLGLAGDASDNIPGVPGVGEKTAVKLLAEFGDLENLLANTDRLKGKQREKVEANVEQARLSRRLATISCDAPLGVGLGDLELHGIDRESLAGLLRTYEFNALGKRLLGESFSLSGSQGELFGEADTAPPPAFENIETRSHKYEIVRGAEARAALAQKLGAADVLCFDTETTSLDTFEAQLVGLAFSLTEGEAFYVPAQGEEDAAGMLQCFRTVLEDPGIEKVGHNLKYDIEVLRRYGVHVSGPIFDTMLAHYVVDPGQRHSMDHLSRTYLKYDPVSIETLIGPKGPEQKLISDVPVEAVADYAAEDADVTLRLSHVLRNVLREQQAERVARECENPLVHVLVAMESEGIRIDHSALEDYSVRLGDEIASLEKRIYAVAGVEFNIASPKQLGEILFERLKVEAKPKKTRTGQYATNEQVLTRLAHDHELAALVLEYRACQKLKSTYVDTLPGAIRPETGRVHTTFSQAVTATGRLQSQNPNLQNIPIRTERGREIRRAFIARDENYVLLSADYSQIELRVMAAISGDEALKQTFLDGVDVHTATAARVNEVEIDAVTAEMRRQAKMVNFGIIYGISAFGLSQRLGIPRSEAAEIIEAYFLKYPGVKAYMDRTVAEARKNGFVTTVLGRRRSLPDIHSRNATTRQGAERNAINTPIQGSAADMIKLAMIRIHGELTRRKLQSRMLLQVHDELVFDMHKAERDEVRALVCDGMREALDLDVPIVVEMGEGDNWLDAH